MTFHRVVYIVDDDRGLLQTLDLILSSAGMLTSSYVSSRDFLKHSPHLAPGCVLLDYWMPPPSGGDVLPLMQTRVPLPVIVMTGRSDVETAVAAIKGGAVDFIAKPFSYLGLISAISRILDELDKSADIEEVEAAILKIAMLTKREREVLQAYEDGLTTKQAAHLLGISVRTVEAHRAHLLERLGAKRLTEAVRLSVTARLGAFSPSHAS